MKTHWSRGMAPLILSLGSRNRTVVSYTLRERTPRTHCLGGWVGSRDGVDVSENTKSLPSAGNQTPDFPAYSVVTVLTELSRLHYLGKFSL
jgi:hypothetical protein